MPCDAISQLGPPTFHKVSHYHYAYWALTMITLGWLFDCSHLSWHEVSWVIKLFHYVEDNILHQLDLSECWGKIDDSKLFILWLLQLFQSSTGSRCSSRSVASLQVILGKMLPARLGYEAALALDPAFDVAVCDMYLGFCGFLVGDGWWIVRRKRAKKGSEVEVEYVQTFIAVYCSRGCVP